MDATALTASFIVRVSIDPAGRLAGTVERVRTGEKRRFDGIDTVAAVIARMMSAGEEPL
jgi:hypothetical protein